MRAFASAIDVADVVFENFAFEPDGDAAAD